MFPSSLNYFPALTGKKPPKSSLPDVSQAISASESLQDVAKKFYAGVSAVLSEEVQKEYGGAHYSSMSLNPQEIRADQLLEAQKLKSADQGLRLLCCGACDPSKRTNYYQVGF